MTVPGWLSRSLIRCQSCGRVLTPGATMGDKRGTFHVDCFQALNDPRKGPASVLEGTA